LSPEKKIGLLQRKSELSPFTSRKEKAAYQKSLTIAAFILLFVSGQLIPIPFNKIRYQNSMRLQ